MHRYIARHWQQYIHFVKFMSLGLLIRHKEKYFIEKIVFVLENKNDPIVKINGLLTLQNKSLFKICVFFFLKNQFLTDICRSRINLFTENFQLRMLHLQLFILCILFWINEAFADVYPCDWIEFNNDWISFFFVWQAGTFLFLIIHYFPLSI